MPEGDKPSMHCPSCAQPMRTLAVERYDSSKEEIDLCMQCRVIWFDQAESTQMSGAAVIELFKLVNEENAQQRLPLAQSLSCPRCTTHLELTHDICKSGRLSYYRCHSHGRLTPFFQFLREKQFIRSLSPAEINHLRAQVGSVQCSGCGGAVDLGKDTCCPYCGSPISVLDADAVKKALETWSQAEERRHERSTEAVAQAMVQMGAAQARLESPAVRRRSDVLFDDIDAGVDLLEVCIGALGVFFSSPD